MRCLPNDWQRESGQNGRVDTCRTGSYGPKREAGRLHEGSHWGWQALVRTGCAVVASSYPRPFKTATPSGGYKFAIISLAASPYPCQRKVAATPAQKGIKKRARMKKLAWAWRAPFPWFRRERDRSLSHRTGRSRRSNTLRPIVKRGVLIRAPLAWRAFAVSFPPIGYLLQRDER
jgi:hypothetical protein